MRYAPVARLGRGGMGVVDLAKGPDGELVALKRIPVHGTPAEAEQARRRFRREAEVLASLDHPGIVRLLEVLDDGDDVVLVLPHLSGGTLADRVRTGGPLPAAEVEAIGRFLLGALAAAHRQGVVHRDVKPSNVLFDEVGRPHLTDFGVASSRDATAGLTGGGLVVGTPSFMAPEQARGEPAGPAADLFALGATLRFALTGVGPWGPDGPAAFSRAAAGRLVRLERGVAPPPLARLLDALCQPDPRRRPSAASLVGGPAGTGVRTARQPLLARRHGRRTGRRALVAAGGVALAALAATGVVLAGAGEGPGPAAATTPTTTPACPDLPYQPCGADPAPGTDGRRCVGERADYDGGAANGCEAVPDAEGPAALAEADEVSANLVPADDVDTYDRVVPDRAQLLCDGALRVTLTAPAGVAQRLEVHDGDELVGRTGSTDGTPASVVVDEPSCFSDDRTTLRLTVRSIGADRTAEPYLLEVSGSY